MKILVNATTLVVGGGIQIGVSFIQIAIQNHDFEWLFLVSNGIYNNLSKELQEDKRIVLIEIPPAKLFRGKNSRKKIKEITNAFEPDLVYSSGFPSYIKFGQKEIGRYTNPWEINPEPLPWHTIKDFSSIIKTKLGIYYRIFWARKADFIETQTEAAKKGIAKRAFYPLKKIKVIPNSPNQIFLQSGEAIIDFHHVYNRENIAFCLSAPYRHKNLDLIPHVAYELQNNFKINMVFILTIPLNSDLWHEIQETSKTLKVEHLIQNVGSLKLDECIAFYKKAKIVFLPTLLEIFSATYVEAMAMKVPIVTSDLEFAHDNCKGAAQFFKPNKAQDAALKIHNLITDEHLFVNQIQNGLDVLNSYPDMEKKYNDLFNWFKIIIKNEK